MLLRKPVLLIALFCLAVITGLQAGETLTSPFINLQQTLNSCIANAPQRKASVIISDNGILKYKLTYKNGKEEYFSLNLIYYKQIEYLGTTRSGIIIIKSADSKIICQSFRDPKGDVDQLENEMLLMVDVISAEQLNNIQQDLMSIKALLSVSNSK